MDYYNHEHESDKVFLQWISANELFYYYLFFRNMKAFVPDKDTREVIARTNFKRILEMDGVDHSTNIEMINLLEQDEQAYASVFLNEFFKRTSN